MNQMLHRKGRQVYFPTFTMRFFSMFYGQQALSFRMTFVMGWEVKQQNA